jgi:hypothetical protein
VVGRTAKTAARLCSLTQAANGLAFFERSALGHARRGPELTPPLYNALIDLVQDVTGYNGTEEIALAIERRSVSHWRPVVDRSVTGRIDVMGQRVTSKLIGP